MKRLVPLLLFCACNFTAKADTDLMNAVHSACELDSVTKTAGKPLNKDCDLKAGAGEGGDQNASVFTASDYTCKDLFAERPPQSFVKKYGPLDSFVTKHWQPYCSLKGFMDIHNFLLLGNPDTTVQKIQESWVTAESMKDNCPLPEEQLRFNPNYTPPTQSSIGVASGKKHEDWRNSLEEKINRLRDEMIPICCGSSKGQCAQMVKNVQVRWCNPKDDPDVPDECTSEGTFYQIPQDQWGNMMKFIDSHLGSKKGWDQFPIGAGEINISNLFRPDGTPMEALGTIEHELGHACSSIRRQIAISNGHQESIKDWKLASVTKDVNGKPTEGCKVTQATTDAFRHLWYMTGANAETFSCFDGVAKSAENTLFLEPSKPCTNGCPRSHIEESFADWMKYSLGFKQDYAGKLLNEVCTFFRDDLHSLGEDNLRCALKTRSILNQVKGIVGCK